MQERDAPESRLTPQALNRQLKDIVSSLPISSMNLEAFDIIDKMREDDIKKRAEVLNKLLEHAKITHFFKEEINEVLELSGMTGVDQSFDPLMHNLFYFLDLENPNSGGIFNINRAKEIERIAFKKEISLTLHFHFMGGKLSEVNPEDDFVSLNEAIAVVHKDRLNKWKEAYRNLHGEDI